jgi:hypothetical protein
VRTQYTISANFYFNPSFSVFWYHTSPPDASEPNTTYSLVVGDPCPGALTQCWGLIFSTSVDCTLIGRMQHLLAGFMSSCECLRHRVHVWVPWSYTGGWTMLKLVSLFLTLPSLTLNPLPKPFPLLCPGRPNSQVFNSPSWLGRPRSGFCAPPPLVSFPFLSSNQWF